MVRKLSSSLYIKYTLCEFVLKCWVWTFDRLGHIQCTCYMYMIHICISITVNAVHEYSVLVHMVYVQHGNIVLTRIEQGFAHWWSKNALLTTPIRLDWKIILFERFELSKCVLSVLLDGIDLCIQGRQGGYYTESTQCYIIYNKEDMRLWFILVPMVLKERSFTMQVINSSSFS